MSLYDKKTLIATQNIMLGSLRIQEVLQDMQYKTDNYQNLVYDYIAHGLHTFVQLYLKSRKVKNIIALGNQLQSFVKYMTLHNFGTLKSAVTNMKKEIVSTALNLMILQIHHLKNTG